MKSHERPPRMTEEQMKARLGHENMKALKAFAEGEESDITLDLNWTEDEMRELAKKIVEEREAA